MKPIHWPCYLALLLAAALLWRETATGLLRPADEAWNQWLADTAGGPAELNPVVLVLHGGPEGEPVHPLDAALFTRAATKLGASVAAIAVTQLAEGDPSLLTSVLAQSGAKIPPRLVGCLLDAEPQELPVTPLAVEWADAPALGLTHYRGADCPLPQAAGVTLGFLNIPDNSDGIPLVALLGDQLAASFALAAVWLHAGAGGRDPEIQNGHLVLAGDRNISINPTGSGGALETRSGRVDRLELDDLLLAMEQVERDTPAHANIAERVRGRILILGTLELAPAASFRLESGRRLAPAEFQAHAISSLLDGSLHHPVRPAGIALALLLGCAAFASGIRTHTAAAVRAALLLLCLYLLIAIGLLQTFSLLLPTLPAIVLVLFAVVLAQLCRS